MLAKILALIICVSESSTMLAAADFPTLVTSKPDHPDSTPGKLPTIYEGRVFEAKTPIPRIAEFQQLIKQAASPVYFTTRNIGSLEPWLLDQVKNTDLLIVDTTDDWHLEPSALASLVRIADRANVARVRIGSFRYKIRKGRTFVIGDIPAGLQDHISGSCHQDELLDTKDSTVTTWIRSTRKQRQTPGGSPAHAILAKYSADVHSKLRAFMASDHELRRPILRYLDSLSHRSHDATLVATAFEILNRTDTPSHMAIFLNFLASKDADFLTSVSSVYVASILSNYCQVIPKNRASKIVKSFTEKRSGFLGMCGSFGTRGVWARNRVHMHLPDGSKTSYHKLRHGAKILCLQILLAGQSDLTTANLWKYFTENHRVQLTNLHRVVGNQNTAD